MSHIELYPGVKMSASGNTDLPPNSAAIQQVILWDIGPSNPVAPKRPELPEILKTGKEGDPEYDLARMDAVEMLDDYQASLRSYKQQKIDYVDWRARNDGPIELPFWSCDAHAALGYDQKAVAEGRQPMRRYYVSARTRGSEHLPNRGLPEGIKPGKGQAEIERREREGWADLVSARAADPVFGQDA